MDIRRRPPKPPVNPNRFLDNRSPPPPPSSDDDIDRNRSPKASDALPLPLYLTNAVFFTLFFSVAYYLLHRWRDKIRYNTPLHVVTVTELGALIALVASFIYLLGFFGIDFVQSFISRADTNDTDTNDFEDHRLVTCPPRGGRRLDLERGVARASLNN